MNTGNAPESLAESSPAEVDIDRVVSGFELADHAPVLSSSGRKGATTNKLSVSSGSGSNSIGKAVRMMPCQKKTKSANDSQPTPTDEDAREDAEKNINLYSLASENANANTNGVPAGGIIPFEKHEKSPELLEAEDVAQKQERLREVEA